MKLQPLILVALMASPFIVLAEESSATDVVEPVAKAEAVEPKAELNPTPAPQVEEEDRLDQFINWLKTFGEDDATAADGLTEVEVEPSEKS